MNGFHNIIPLNDEEITNENRGPLEVLNDVINALAAQNYGSINPLRSYGSMHSSSHIPYEDSVRLMFQHK